MDQLQYALELASYDEKIALAELEESKAAERVKELRYELTRYKMQWLYHQARPGTQKSQEALKC
jgi:hypothetical protein